MPRRLSGQCFLKDGLGRRPVGDGVPPRSLGRLLRLWGGGVALSAPMGDDFFSSPEKCTGLTWFTKKQQRKTPTIFEYKTARRGERGPGTPGLVPPVWGEGRAALFDVAAGLVHEGGDHQEEVVRGVR